MSFNFQKMIFMVILAPFPYISVHFEHISYFEALFNLPFSNLELKSHLISEFFKLNFVKNTQVWWVLCSIFHNYSDLLVGQLIIP